MCAWFCEACQREYSSDVTLFETKQEDIRKFTVYTVGTARAWMSLQLSISAGIPWPPYGSPRGTPRAFHEHLAGSPWPSCMYLRVCLSLVFAH